MPGDAQDVSLAIASGTAAWLADEAMALELCNSDLDLLISHLLLCRKHQEIVDVLGVSIIVASKRHDG